MGETGQLLRLLKRKAFDAHMQWKQPVRPVLKNSLPHAKLAKLATSLGRVAQRTSAPRHILVYASTSGEACGATRAALVQA